MRNRRILAGILGVVIVLGVGFGLQAWRRGFARMPVPDATAFDPALVQKGAELARIGNCGTCHTTEGGAPFAGGRGLPTPFGTIYSTNITPDPQTGIGAWSERAFRRAMQEGVSRDGHHLYPAFPYDHFTKLTDQDVRAIYAFLMTREAARAQTPANDVAFPFNLRPLLAGWKLLYFKRGRFQPDPSRDDETNRGAYLAELAHCGACHTPRNALGAENRERAFGGGESEGWHAPALNTASTTPVPWTADELAHYLTHGFVRPHGVAAGPMREVTDNLAQASEADVRAIARYVGGILGPATQARRPHAEQVLEQLQHDEDGPPEGPAATGTVGSSTAFASAEEQSLYAGACATCHDNTGQHFSAHGIPLALSKVVSLPDPTNLIHIIREGIEPPAGTPSAQMPGFGDAFTDAQLASLVKYLRRNFSDQPPWRDVDGAIRKLRRQAKG
jgi:mono/diheme cytochrome c family protein